MDDFDEMSPLNAKESHKKRSEEDGDVYVCLCMSGLLCCAVLSEDCNRKCCILR